MAEVLTRSQILLTRYLAAVGCSKLAVMVMVTELWEEEAVIEMLQYCQKNPDASQEQLLKMSSEISSRWNQEE